MNDELNTAVSLLQHPRSAKRRSGAQRLRRLGDHRAGPALLQALKKELDDSRTWETQYQMIMGIGECGYRDALPYLRQLTTSDLSGSMLWLAIGDAMVRLSRTHENDASAAIHIIRSGPKAMIVGAMQAVAMLCMVPGEEEVGEIVRYGTSLIGSSDDWALVWILRAAPGWSGPAVAAFLQECSKVPFHENQQIHDATRQAIRGEYGKWNPA